MKKTITKQLLLTILISLSTHISTAAEVDSKTVTGSLPSAVSDSLDYAQVTAVSASQRADGSWCFDVSVRHNDQGWEHYADGWEVLDQSGNQLGYRLLAHPHDNEQPFTRSQCNIKIPEAVTEVTVRARCNQHEFGGQSVLVDLTTESGDNYSVRKPN